VGVGLASPIGQKFALWDQQGLAVDELAHRKELNFPPHHRLASVTGPRQLVDAVVKDLAGQVSAIKSGSLEILGPIAIEQEPAAARNPVQVTEPLWRYLIRFDYSLGEVLASELKARGLKVNAGNKSVNAKSGRSSRAVRIKMDDSEVI
jgi:primosomal protein N' (replication factor Y)